jgi:hypothetical protein
VSFAPFGVYGMDVALMDQRMHLVGLRSLNWTEPPTSYVRREDLQEVAGGVAARDEGRPYGASRRSRSNGIFVISPAHLLGVGRRVGGRLYKSLSRSDSAVNPT